MKIHNAFCFVVCLGLSLSWMTIQSASAAQVLYIGASGNWTNSSANWSNATTKLTGFPASNDYAVIANAFDEPTVTLNSDVGSVNRIWVGSGGYSAGIFNVVKGARLYTPGSSEIGYRTNGIMTMTGGYFRSGTSTGTQRINVGVDTTNYVHTGTLVISGGTNESKFTVGSSGIDGASADRMRIIGADAKIFSGASQSGSGSGLTVGSSGRLEFIFASNGISSLTFTNSNASFDSGSRIIVDGAAYTGSTQTFTLIRALVFTNGTPSIMVTNFGPGATCSWDSSAGLFTVTASARQTTNIYVAAYADDGEDDAMAINAAIAAAQPGDRIVFAPGIYDLINPYDTARFLNIYKKQEITLMGAVDAGGEPTTVLLRHVALENDPSPPRTINISSVSGVTLKNFIMDNSPHLCTSGEITEIDPAGKFVKARIFDGLPMDDGCACYAANVWVAGTKDLKETASLSFMESPGNWSVIDAANRIMKLENSAGLGFPDGVNAGDYISWHYGVNGGAQISSGASTNLTIENLLVKNIISTGMVLGTTDGIILRDITMKSEGAQLPVGPRDGIHISRCTGAIVAEGLDITGVRWDAFVVHVPYAVITAVTDSTRLTVASIRATAGVPIPAGSALQFIDAGGVISTGIVSSAVYTMTTNDWSYYNVTLSNSLPSFAAVGTGLKIQSFGPSSVTLTDSIFENIAGSALILLTDNIVVSNTSYRKIMYSAAHIGANPTTGVAGDNVKILDSVFDTCGWIAKADMPGVITMANLCPEGLDGVLRYTVIKNNLFKNYLISPTNPVLNIADAFNFTVESNTFENVYCGMKIDAATTSGYQGSGNTVIIDNDSNTVTYAETSGDFFTSSLKGYNSSTSRYSGSAGASAEWQFIAPRTGAYAVYIYKVVHTNSDNNARISVANAGSTAVSYVNYTTGTSGWYYLGTYNFTGQANYIISNQRQSGNLRADAVKFIQQ